MSAIHVSVCFAPVRGALRHGDHDNCAYLSSSLLLLLLLAQLYYVAVVRDRALSSNASVRNATLC